MNENKFQSQRTHTRVKFEPLNITCSLVCLTPQSPVTQTVNTTLSPIEYEPDRALSPTLILPDVRAVDVDNVFKHGSANENLALDSITWLANGKPIASVWNAGTDYEIITDASDLRGTIRVKKNLGSNEKVVLHFLGEFLDWRTGQVYKVESDDIALTCSDKGENAIQCHVDKPIVEYDPLYDDLLLYDYKIARGISVQGSRDSHRNGKSFEQEVSVVLTYGTTQQTILPTDVTMRLVKLGTSTPLTPNSESSPEILQVSYPTMKFDMRMISKAEYEVQFVKAGKVIANATFGLHTQTTMPVDGQPLFGSDIAASQEEYFNSLIVNLADRVVEYPELYYLIQWYTQAKYNDNGVWKYAEQKTRQRGVNIEVAVKDLGIGLTHNDSFFDIWFELEAHKVCQLVTDESGNVLTDESGNFLID